VNKDIIINIFKIEFKESLSSKIDNIYCLKNSKKKSRPKMKMDIFKMSKIEKPKILLKKDVVLDICDENALKMKKM
jgi:hypothetical protein